MVAASVDDGGAIIAVPVGEDIVQRVEECAGAVVLLLLMKAGLLLLLLIRAS